jgi:uncharacterized protein YciI
MDKKYFALKLNPSRPDFAQTLTDDERTIMRQHATYWREHMAKGKVIVFGPVLDPKAVYGFGIVAVDNEQEVKDFIAGDPAAAINSYEYYPMLAVVPEK